MTDYWRYLTSLTAILLALHGSWAQCDTLRLGLTTEHQSIDPHFSRTSPNQNTAKHVFESLTSKGANLEPVPSLAVNWEQLDQYTWRIELRPNVRFHDGSEFDAQDVITTVDRIPNVKNSPAPYGSFVTNIKSIQTLDPLTLIVNTKTPEPDFMSTFGSLFILPSELGESLRSSEFDSGKAAVGTGPYQFVSWTPNESLVLRSFAGYWGAPPEFEDVIVRYIPNDASRVAMLMAGDIDAIDKLPPSVVSAAEARDSLRVTKAISGRVIYLHLDSDRSITPFVKGVGGENIHNPLLDARVRKALSLMIDRRAITSHIMYGFATPTAQLVPEGLLGYSPTIDVSASPTTARALLAEAGYPDGFSLTIHGSNDRYVNDSKILQAIAQLFARNGIKVKVEVMPKNIYFTAASRRDFSVFMMGFAPGVGSSLLPMKFILGTYDPLAGFGAFNRGRYSNAEVDEMIRIASRTSDPAERERFLLAAVTRALAEDQAVIPLHFEHHLWAHDVGVAYDATLEELTLAQRFHRVP